MGLPLPESRSGLTIRQAVASVLTRDQTEEEQATVERLKLPHPAIGGVLVLLEGFTQLVRDGSGERLKERPDQWILDAEGSGLPEFKAFVVKLRQDLNAVLAGLSLPWSQGQAESQIDRLKTIK